MLWGPLRHRSFFLSMIPNAWEHRNRFMLFILKAFIMAEGASLNKDLDSLPLQDIAEFVDILDLRKVIENQDDHIRTIVATVD